jgi:hypothetical protein
MSARGNEHSNGINDLTVAAARPGGRDLGLSDFPGQSSWDLPE